MKVQDPLSTLFAMPMKAHRLFCGVIAVLLIFLSACSGCSPQTPQISIEEPEATCSPVLIGVGSVFMKIVNSGRGDDTLVAVHAAIPGTLTELHTMEDGKMVKVDRIRIPPKGTVVLRPANLHIMIFRMPNNLKAGSEFSLVLTFERSGEKQLKIQFERNKSSITTRRHR